MYLNMLMSVTYLGVPFPTCSQDKNEMFGAVLVLNFGEGSEFWAGERILRGVNFGDGE